MHNLFPTHPLGETIGFLVAEHLREPERETVCKVSQDWQVAEEHASTLSKKRSAEIVEIFSTYAQEILSRSFIQRMDGGQIKKKIQQMSQELYPGFLEIFNKFSARELGALTTGPFCDLLQREHQVMLKEGEAIAKEGARFLQEIIFTEQREEIQIQDPQTVAECLADQTLQRWADRIIAGSVRRFQVSSSHSPGISAFQSLIIRVKTARVSVDLFRRLVKTFRTSLASCYASNFCQEDICKLLVKRTQVLYQTIEGRIFRQLHLRAIAWITEDQIRSRRI